MSPTLPAEDPAPDARARGLEQQRERYRFVYDEHGMLSAGDLPLSERDDAKYWAELALAQAALAANRLLAHPPGPDEGLQGYARLYATIPAPPIVGCWEQDEVFAWQAVAGTNPVVLRRLERRMDHFRVRVQGLDAAIAEGRAYVADYAMLEGLPDGEVDGRRKYGFAPIALYLSRPEGLRAVAIQTGQTPDWPVFTPADGVSWRMARTCVTTAEGNLQGVVSHFALCHQVMEAVIVASRRELSDRHPVLVLLAPHFRDTLQTNAIAKKSLYGPGGNMERLQSPTLEASLGLARQQLAAFRLAESAPHEDFARRGVDDRERLPDYPARDDALIGWQAVLAWVDGYLRLYYPTDAQVAADVELAAWVDALSAPDGGNLSGLSRPRTVQELIGLVARIVFRSTIFHASINYSSFPLFSFPPNVQTAAFAPGPTGDDTAAAYEAMIPPFEYAREAFDLFWSITVRLDRMGDYRRFADPRVEPLLAAYRAELARVDEVVAERNRSRRMAYPWMSPCNVPMSIQV